MYKVTRKVITLKLGLFWGEVIEVYFSYFSYVIYISIQQNSRKSIICKPYFPVSFAKCVASCHITDSGSNHRILIYMVPVSQMILSKWNYSKLQDSCTIRHFQKICVY